MAKDLTRPGEAYKAPARRQGRAAAHLRISLAVILVSLAALIFIAPGCEKAPKAPKVLIVGIDGADWGMIRPLLSEAELPNLRGMIQEGAHGPLRSMNPNTSPIIWTTIATGKGPDQHGILDFTMPDPDTGDPIIISSSMRRSMAFWNILSEQGLSVCVVGWWASWPAEPIRGVMVSDRLSKHAFIQTPEVKDGLVSPPERLAEILALRPDAADVPFETAKAFMDITPEEYEAAPALDFRNPISHFRHIYQTMTNYAEITKHLMRKDQPDVMAVYFEGLDAAAHMYMRYAPPAYPYTTEEQRRKFGHTVEAFYKYQDQLLGELFGLADENTTVVIVSGHGFKTGGQRPIEKPSEIDYITAARWHRMEGVILMKGPRIKSRKTEQDPPAIFRKATVFDITPTVLAMLNLPGAADMDGRILSEMLADDFPAPARMETYEDQAWRDSRAQARTQAQHMGEVTKQKPRGPGYIGAGESEEIISLRSQESLAEYYFFRKQYDKAEKELRDLIRRAPDWEEPYYHLGLVFMQRHDIRNARSMYEKALELAPRKLEARLNLAFIYRQQNDRQRAIELLERGAEDNPYHSGMRTNLGMLHREMRNQDRAMECFAEVLRGNPDNYTAHAQSALIYEDQGKVQKALEHWTEACRINPRDETARNHLKLLKERIGGAAGG